MKYLAHLCLTAALLLSGCVSITPEQEHYYALYQTDPHPPFPAPEVSELQIAVSSLFLPGVGHLIIGEPQWAPLWCLLGILSPGTAPIAAVADARTVNRIQIAEEYKKYLANRRQSYTPDDIAIEYHCHACGFKVRADAHYCPGCGRKR